MKISFGKICAVTLTILILASSIGVMPVHASTLTVMNTNDSGSGSLRDTLASAGNGDTITFDSGLSGTTISLDSTLILSQNVTIDGSSLASKITISGNDMYRIIEINTSITVTLNSLIIAHGRSQSDGSGGGISNTGGTLTIINSSISNNSIDSWAGGGIHTYNGTLTVIDSVISNNSGAEFGGGIYTSNSELTVTDSIISGNSAGGGGGIFTVGQDNDDIVTITGSTISSNSAGYGGGIQNSNSVVTLTDTTFSENTSGDGGGAIWNDGALTINDSSFSNHEAELRGGGIFHSTGTLKITNSHFSNNSVGEVVSTGGAIQNEATLTLTNSDFSGNSAELGGAIYHSETASTLTITSSTFSNNTAEMGGAIFNYSAPMIVKSSTFSGNSALASASEPLAGSGGGILNGGTLAVTNSTFVGNSASWYGGGIDNSGTATIRNSTFSGNIIQDDHQGSTAGIYSGNFATLNLANTIIANSINGIECFADGTLAINTHNLIEDGSCSASLSGEAYLAPLADNGGPTQTIALLAGSPAFDAGDDAVCTAAPVNGLDQRGISRPQDTHCDIGAFEGNVPDTFPPSVVSIERTTDTSGTTNLQIDFAVTFSEKVTGVTLDDFSLTTTGVSGASLASVSGFGLTRIVTVNTGTGNGTIRLDLNDNDSIHDLASNRLGGTGMGNGNFSNGETYTVTKTMTFTSSPAQDGWVLESSETSNMGGTLNSTATTFNLGDDATKKQYRGILSFYTVILPNDAVITSVILKVKKNMVVGGGNPVSIFQGFIADVKTGFFTTSWILENNDFQTVASKSVGPTSPALINGWYNINLINAKAFINTNSASGITQIRLRFKLDDNNNTIANYLSLYSGNAPAADRPQLVITCYVP